MTARRPTVGLAVPLFNEVELVDTVAEAYTAGLAATGLDWTLVLVDNGSADGTGKRVAAWSARPGVLAVHLPENAGYGGGIRAGLRVLEERNTELLGWGWGDGQVDARVLPSLTGALLRGAELAKVRRVSRRDGWRRSFVTRTYARLHHLLGARSPDVNGCPKLLRREALQAAALESEDWFLDPELLLFAESRGWSIVEIPAAMEARAAGQSKVRWQTAASLGLQVLWWHLRQRR